MMGKRCMWGNGLAHGNGGANACRGVLCASFYGLCLVGEKAPLGSGSFAAAVKVRG